MADGEQKALWRVRAYHASRRFFDLSVAAARAVFVGVWLGVLDRRSIHAADELYYRRAQMYRTDSHNRSGLFAWEAEAVDQHFHGCRSVLVSSVGGGREVLALEQRGFEVFGFECHPELVQAANDLLARRGLKARVSLAPRDECPSIMPMCDGAVVGWGGYMLIQERTRRIEFLRQLRAHVPVGGPLLLSFFARHGDTRYLRLASAIATALRTIRRQPRAEVGDDLAPNFVHYFSEAEMARELEAGGFRMVEFSRAGYPHAVAHAA